MQQTKELNKAKTVWADWFMKAIMLLFLIVPVISLGGCGRMWLDKEADARAGELQEKFSSCAVAVIEGAANFNDSAAVFEEGGEWITEVQTDPDKKQRMNPSFYRELTFRRQWWYSNAEICRKPIATIPWVTEELNAGAEWLGNLRRAGRALEAVENNQ